MYKKMYLKEFELYDGECFVTFNILDIKTEDKKITLAISRQGKISVDTYELRENSNGLYFEYGVMCNEIYTDNFEEVAIWN